MKECKNYIFKKMVKNAIRTIKRRKIKTPGDGLFRNIIHKRTKKGQWQVEYVNDARLNDKPYVIAYFFRGRDQSARSADTYFAMDL